VSISTAQWAAGQADIIARQIAGDLTESEAAAELLALTLDWSGLIPANGSLPAMGAKVTEFTDLTATRDGDISAWSQGTVDAVITDPVGQPEPGHYPIRIQGGATVWIPSPAAVVSGTQKGDAGANVGQEFAVVAGTSASDPGAGGIKFNHATPASITAIYVDNLNRGGTDVSAWLDALSTQTTAVRAQLTLRQLDSDKVLTFNVTGPVSSASTYRTIPGTVVGAAVAFDVGAKVVIAPGFTPAMLDEAAAATALALEKSGEANDAAAAANAARDAARYKAAYLTRAALYDDLDHDAGTLGVVIDDPTVGYSGTYGKAGASGTGSWTKIDSTGGLVFQSLAPETGYLFALMDSAGRAALMVTVDGSLKVTKFLAQSITQAALALAAVGTAQMADGAVTAAKLDPTGVAPMIAKYMNPAETGFVWAILDLLNRYAIAIKPDGTVKIPKLELGLEAVGLTNLKSEVSGYVARFLTPETGYVWGVFDSAGRIGLAIKLDGTIVGKFANALTNGSVTTIKIADGAVTEAKLDPPIARLAVPHIGDVVEVMPDAWRSKLGSVATRTEVAGSSWAQFPEFLTRSLRGVNSSGQSLDFRRSSGLEFRGRRKGADWSPVATTAVSSLVNKGDTLDPASLATSGRTVGDYYRYSGTSAGTVSFDGQTVGLGDLVVWDGSAFKAQKAPTPAASGSHTSRERADWWAVTAAGTFDGVAYEVGDRIVCIGFDSKSGAGNVLWYKGKAASDGELFYCGEHDASGGAYPSSPGQGDVYQISVPGTLGGVAHVAGDYIVYDAAVWGRVPGNPVVTVANGAMIPALGCIASASEWEVRRSDKSNTRVGVSASGRHQVSPRRSVDGILCRSDSMFGVADIVTNLLALVAPRQVVRVTRGGGTSDNVLSTKEYEIAVLGDLYRGWFEFIWQGQNNQPSAVGDANWCRVTECALRLAQLLGVRDKRFGFLSILGSMSMTFNGTRVVVTQWEGMFAGTHVLAKLEQWYAANFPGAFVNTRAELLAQAAASTLPDPRVLGTMTEAQTAAAYGWIPYSWMKRPVAWPFNPATLNYVGWWTGNGTLPTGGADGDAYTRSSGNSSLEATSGVGNLIVKHAGVWAEYAPDTIHIGPATSQGGGALAIVLNNHLQARKV